MSILRRRTQDRFSEVVRWWEGSTCVILGGGPSLTLEQFELARAAHEAGRVRAIAVNDSYLCAPWADVCYAADSKWFEWHRLGIDKPKLGLTAAQVRERWASFEGEKVGIQCAEPYIPDGVHILRVAVLPPDQGLSRDRGALATGRHDGYTGHSGFQALNLAVLAGAQKIILLGFDGRPGADGKTHHHGEHPIPTPADVWDHIRRSFSCVENELNAAGVDVINCSPSSAIDTFPKYSLHDSLNGIPIPLWACGHGCCHYSKAEADACAAIA